MVTTNATPRMGRPPLRAQFARQYFLDNKKVNITDLHRAYKASGLPRHSTQQSYRIWIGKLVKVGLIEKVEEVPRWKRPRALFLATPTLYQITERGRERPQEWNHPAEILWPRYRERSREGVLQGRGV